MQFFCMFIIIKLQIFQLIRVKLMIPETDFSIRYFIGGYDNNITYLITCNISKRQVIVDAAIDIGILLPFIDSEPSAILITHTHTDHISFIDEYIEKFPSLTIIGHSDSANLFKRKNFKYINHKHIIKIGKLLFTAIHTPGHYYDSICYLLKPVIFTGDTIFVGRTGRVKSKSSSINKLYNSVYHKILTLPDNIRIYPGHDYGKKLTIQIKENKKISPLLRAKDLNDFISIMKEYEMKR